MKRDNLYPIRKLHGKLHDARVDIERQLRLKRELKNGQSGTVYLVGTPIHPNVGDSAIVLAELFFLKKTLPKGLKLVEIPQREFRKYRKLAIRSMLRSEGCPVLWHGGGNMGDVWIGEELIRREALVALDNKRIISFPQTIFYSDTDKGRKNANASIPYYNGRKGLTLNARERRSYEIMRFLYPETEINLMPDIVLSSSAEEFGVSPCIRKGVLMCLRNDVEKSIGNEFWEDLKKRVGRMGESVRVTDMEATSVIFTDTRAEIVRRKMQEFRGAKLAITDRLHGMVFAALTGTPCVVFSNNNHKVKSTYDWISYLPYIRYAETMEEAENCIPELLAMENCEFDNTPLMPYFEKLKGIIQEACRLPEK